MSIKTTNEHPWDSICSSFDAGNLEIGYGSSDDRVASLRIIEAIGAMDKVLSFSKHQRDLEKATRAALYLLQVICLAVREFKVRPRFPKLPNNDAVYVMRRLAKNRITNSSIILSLSYCLHVSQELYNDDTKLLQYFIDTYGVENETE